MSETSGIMFGFRINKLWGRQFSLGVAINHWAEETYLFISFIKWTIAIGFLYKYEDCKDAAED